MVLPSAASTGFAGETKSENAGAKEAVPAAWPPEALPASLTQG